MLTDAKFFQGGFENLTAIRQAGVTCPLLCKEFIVEVRVGGRWWPAAQQCRLALSDSVTCARAAAISDYLSRQLFLSPERAPFVCCRTTVPNC